jgi:hypothetical protein
MIDGEERREEENSESNDGEVGREVHIPILTCMLAHYRLPHDAPPFHSTFCVRVGSVPLLRSSIRQSLNKRSPPDNLPVSNFFQYPVFFFF